MAIAENQTAHIYKDRQEYDKAINLYLSSTAHADKEKIKGWDLKSWWCISYEDKLDSSLRIHKAYENFIKVKSVSNPYLFRNLGGVQSKMGNASLAVSYFNMGIDQSMGTSNIRYLNLAYTGLADHYHRFKQTDSSVFYAKKAIAVVNKTSFFYLEQ